MATRRVGGTDRFGNPVDPTVGYAHGRILRGTDEEVAKTLWARRLVGERIAARGSDAVFDLTGMNRGCPLEPEDLPALRSHVPFFARFEGAAEPVAIKYMGGDPERHDAVILNRVSAATLVTLLCLVRGGETVASLAPSGGQTHPSVRRPVAMAGGRLREFSEVEALERAWPRLGRVRLLVVTPISASKHHLPAEAFRRAVAFARKRKALVFVDDAHMASRTAFYEEPPAFAVADVDLAVCSADKHVAGPRAGVLVGRRDLIAAIRSRAFELGLDAQAGQYAGVYNALRNFDPKPVAEAGRLARQLLPRLQARYGESRAYLGGPGVSIGGEDAVEIARERAGHRRRPRLTPVEANALMALSMLREHGILTISAVAMPGSAPVVRLMMYPDGGRLGLERLEAALGQAFDRLSEVLDDLEAARPLILGI